MNSSQKEEWYDINRWGHLRPGKYRYRFESKTNDFTIGKKGLLDDEASSTSSLSTDDKDDAEKAMNALYKAARTSSISGQVAEGVSLVGKISKEVIRRSSVAIEIGAKRGSKVLDQSLNAISEQVRRASEMQQAQVKESDHSVSDDEEYARPQTPAWARNCGLKIQKVGPLFEEDISTNNMYENGSNKWLSIRSIEIIISFLNPRAIALICMVGKEWLQTAYNMPSYVDILHLGHCTVQIFAHSGRVDSIMIYPPNNMAILSSGDKRILAWDAWDSGRGALETPMRDTVHITNIFVACGSLWTVSKNGCIREYALSHDPESIEFRSQFWEHTAQINDCTTSQCCDFFAGDQSKISGVRHRAKLLSCSDDRTVRVWNIDLKRCDAIIQPFSHRSATMRSLAVSDHHIYVGASDGCVYVYSATSKTRRLANKKKKRLGVEAIFPLEIELQCGRTVVSVIRTSKSKNNTLYHSQLFVASWDATLRIWAIPKSNLDFRLIYTLSQHTDRITALHISTNYIITASDDSSIRFYGRYHHDYDNMFVERTLHVGGRVKCLALAHAPSPQYSGVLTYGLSDGTVGVHPYGPSL